MAELPWGKFEKRLKKIGYWKIAIAAVVAALAVAGFLILGGFFGERPPASEGISPEVYKAVNELKHPDVIAQTNLTQEDVLAAFGEEDEFYTVLKLAGDFGYQDLLGTVRTDYKDGNAITVGMLANSGGSVIFIERLEAPGYSKTLLISYTDEEHYTMFDAEGGIKRDGADFTKLGREDIAGLSLEGGMNPGNGILAPDIIRFGFCDEKGGGFRDCILENKLSLGLSVVGAIAACIGSGVGGAFTAVTLGAFTPAEIALVLGCIGAGGSALAIIGQCSLRLADNNPKVDAFSQITGDCYKCISNKRMKLKEVRITGSVEDDRLPNPTWSEPNASGSVSVCDTGDYIEKFTAVDCGGNIKSEYEEITLPEPELAAEQCVGGDGCCPSGCTEDNDNDCIGECGNNVAEGSEECDGPDFGGKDCKSFGYAPGALTCTAGCLLDASGCGNCWTDADCDDENACTDDACADFTCKNTQKAGCCTNDADCDDDDLCTTDVCNASNRCENTTTTTSPGYGSPQSGSDCNACAGLGLECREDFYAPGYYGCCPQNYCLVDSFCQPECTLVDGKICKSGSWT